MSCFILNFSIKKKKKSAKLGFVYALNFLANGANGVSKMGK